MSKSGKVHLYRPHTHAGIAYVPGPEGVEITTTPEAAAFIKARGLDKPLAAVPARAYPSATCRSPVCSGSGFFR